MIGGEFDFSIEKDIPKKDFFCLDGFFYSSGRAALYHCIKHAISKNNYKQIMLPDYLCESILDIVYLFDLPILYYSLNEDLSVNLNQLEDSYKKRSLVLFINYFGILDNSHYYQVLKQIDSEVCIIEDNVQSFYKMYESRSADYSFSSFRKTFPVPDGGWVKSKYSDLEQVIGQNHFAQYKIAASTLKSLREDLPEVEDKFYMSLFDQGEKLINADINAEISSTTSGKIQIIDFKSVKNKRKRNADFVVKELAKLEIFPIVPYLNEIPLFIPIRLRNRDKIRKMMFSKGIFCPVHWPVRKKEFSCLKRGEELSKNELSLIIDQRYNVEQLASIIHIIKDNINA